VSTLARCADQEGVLGDTGFGVLGAYLDLSIYTYITCIHMRRLLHLSEKMSERAGVAQRGKGGGSRSSRSLLRSWRDVSGKASLA
jgi:hypothetical protein